MFSSPRTLRQAETILISCIVAAHFLLSIGFSLVIPLSEAEDERQQYEYAREIIRLKNFPDARTYRKQYFQPPLYYLAISPVLLLVDDSDFPQTAVRPNPYRYIHQDTGWDILGSDNKNHTLHSRNERFPYKSGTVLAAHIMRLSSVIAGTLVVVLSYFIARLVWPNPKQAGVRILAAALPAFWPQFAYMNGVITNDVFQSFLFALALWLMLRQMKDGWSVRSTILTGIVLGAALLTELTGAIIAGIVGLIMFTHPRSRRRIPLLLGVIVLVAGWWYVRNWAKYGDPTAVEVMYKYWPEDRYSPNTPLSERAETLPWIYETWWARFGSNTIMVRGWIYRVFDGMVILSVSGLLYWVWRNRRIIMRWIKESPPITTRLVIANGLLAGTVLAATVVYTFQNSAGFYGRFLLLAMAAWTVLLITGMTTWVSARVPLSVGAGGAVFLAAVAGFALWDYASSFRIYPVPEKIETALAYNFEGQAELLGTDSSLIRAHPGARITVSLYWQSFQPTPDDLTVYVHSIESPVVRRNSYPATGNLLSTEWKPGEKWAEWHIIRIPADAQPQRVYTLVAGLYDPASQYTLQATNRTGEVVTPVIGQLAISNPPTQLDTSYRFGQFFGLATPEISYDGQQVNTCLPWHSLQETSVSYTTFIHIMDTQGNMLAQQDFLPRQGAYPTHAWAKGEVIEDCVTIPAARLPDTWSLSMGLYNLDDMVRLPVYDLDTHERLANDELVFRSDEVTVQ